MYAVAGYTVNTAEQARTLLLVAMLKGDTRIAQQARSVLEKLELAGA